ncbi:MAG: hypothetical protein MMC33_003197 [Icmadophila ericetorum]|nr:hypothetical protein [Icmadophila ericetorum]
MSSTQESKPIQIHISPALRHLAVPLKDFLKNHPEYACLAVGAFIFWSAHHVTTPSSVTNSSRLLLVKRAASETAFPNRWEVPGGSSEHSDPTILHSIAREVFEETGLRLARVVQQVGDGVEFTTGWTDKSQRWLKLSFEIEVAEIEPAHCDFFSVNHNHINEIPVPTSIEVSLDPNEHQDYRWVSEEEIQNAGEGEGLQIMTEDQRAVMLEAFNLHRTNRAVLENPHNCQQHG